MTRLNLNACVLFVLPLVLPSHAFACSVAQPASEVVFYDMPRKLPENASIILVYFPRAGDVRPGISPRRAKILKVVRGSSKASWINVLVDGAQSGGCRWATTNGKTGYIIGHFHRGEANSIVFDPLYETIEQRRQRGGLIKTDPPSGVPEIKPFYIGTPEWVKEPSEGQLKRYLPRISGNDFRYSKFRCMVNNTGDLKDCKNIGGSPFKDEELYKPWNEAMPKVLSLYRLKEKTWKGWSVEGGQVEIAIRRQKPKRAIGL